MTTVPLFSRCKPQDVVEWEAYIMTTVPLFSRCKPQDVVEWEAYNDYGPLV